MEKHDHSGMNPNSDKVFSTFIGCKVAGLLHDRNTGGGGVTILVFECGWGLAINDNGSQWIESPSNISTLVDKLKTKLAETRKEYKDLLKLAGAVDETL